jgi:hypothetical protein
MVLSECFTRPSVQLPDIIVLRTLPFVLKELEPLREAGFLTTFANGTLKPSALVVVGTGNSPLEQVKALEPRDYFFDAPLTQLTDPSLNTTWDITLSPLASTDYEVAVGWSGIGNISDAQRANITKFVGDAHTRGIRARYSTCHLCRIAVLTRT